MGAAALQTKISIQVLVSTGTGTHVTEILETYAGGGARGAGAGEGWPAVCALTALRTRRTQTNIDILLHKLMIYGLHSPYRCKDFKSLRTL